MSSPQPATTCPNCGAESAGKYCSECGSALLGVSCGVCRTLLTPGARFCHRCGAAVGTVVASAVPLVDPRAADPAPRRSILPWAIGTAAVLALVITVAVQQSKSQPAASTASSPDIPLDNMGDAAGDNPFAAGNGASPGMRAPDISSMSPRERADRLYDRVMRLASEGKTDSSTFFATMAAQAYEMLGPLDNDLKYDYGRMAEMSGNLPLAKQQAEAILQNDGNHLLGLILGARVAQLQSDAAARARYNQKLLAVQSAELARGLDEYTRHRGDIDVALEEARAGSK